ncbi:MAG: deoxyribose-phosphate aldolase [Planctomycetales bacterium]|nr:deoxyribose-phosphate aldolase [Planctomycetales bacterium]
MVADDDLARLIDHSLLHPTLSDAEIRAGCELALRYNVAAVCVKPAAVRLVADLLAGSQTAVCTVVGFPHGANLSEVKAFEAERACRDGASELDMVVNVGWVLAGEWDRVVADICGVVDVAHDHGAITKVIFENDYLPDDTVKIRLCEICREVGAEYVKTSTGFGFVRQPDGHYDYRGATDADVRLMVEHAGPAMRVKAAGGIRTRADAEKMRDLGVSRIGASATAAILDAPGS